MSYLTLALAVPAVLAETIGTAAPPARRQFTRLLASVVVMARAAAFYLPSVLLRATPAALAHAMWSGLGIVFISRIGPVAFGQKPDQAAILGMGLIVAGILGIHLFSGAAPH